MTTATKTPDQMSVSELRDWLNNFGKQQQDHFQQNQVRRGRSPDILRGGRRHSVKERARGFEQPKQQETTSTTTATTMAPGDENIKPTITVTNTEIAPSSRGNDAEPVVVDYINPTTTPTVFTSSHGNEVEPLVPDIHVSTPYNTSDFAAVGTTTKQQFEPVVSSPSIMVQNPEGTDEFETTFQEQFLALTMTQSSWSSSVEANASSDESSAVELGVTESIDEDKPMVFESQPRRQHQLPQTWSDMESFDFDSASSSSSSDEEEPKDTGLEIKLGLLDGKKEMNTKQPNWDDFLKRQAAPRIQHGYWSDHNDGSDDDEEGDNLSIATGLMTEPPRSSNNNGGWRSRKSVAERRRERNYRRQAMINTSHSLSLSDFAMASGPDFSPVFFAEGATKKEDKNIATFDNTPTTSMHNANLFHNKTMTSRTLDVICKGSRSSKSQRPTLGDFFEQREEDGTTTSSWSEDSGKPSVNPDAVDPKLGKLFHSTANTNISSSRSMMTANAYGATTATETRQDDDSSPRSTDIEQRDPALFTPSQSFDSLSVSSSFSSAVQKFGGTGSKTKKAARRKSRIERQKEALEQKWAAERVPKHVKKTKWQVDKSSGTYKKKIVLDFD